MKLDYTGINIMGDLLRLFPYDKEVLLDADLMGQFNLILVAGGIIPQTETEVSQCLDILGEMDIVDIYFKDNQYFAKGLIEYGL